MLEFLKKMTEWMLEREEEMAKKCALPLSELDRQIAKVESKKKELQEECEKNQAELEKILVRLKWMRAEELKCHESGDAQSSQA